MAGYDDATALLTNDNDTSASSSAAVASRSSAIRSDLDKERRDKIKSLQHIIFDRQPLDETSTTSIVRIHGSVSNEDIAKHIRHSLGIHLERDEVEILKGENDLGVSEDKKIKTLGAFKAKVLIEDFEWVVDVEVKTPTTT